MKRAKHNLGHYRVTAGDMGLLYPYSVTEVLPGDTLRCSASALIRMQPLMTPLMHPVDISISHFYVPHRITWPEFEKFITGQTQINIPAFTPVSKKGDIEDYMGVPVGTGPRNALPVYAYNLIWNEFFRDQDIQVERPINERSVANVAWSKDYFTTARPYAQSGGDLGESAQITFADDVPIDGLFAQQGAPYQNLGTGFKNSRGENTSSGTIGTTAGPSGLTNFAMEQNPDDPGAPFARIAAGAVSGYLDINEWRRAMALQRFRETRNKFGSRYKDYLAFLGVKSADGRLDRPEYLGGGRQTIAFSEVLQTTESTETPLGTQGGHGIAAIRTRPWRRFFAEHGYVLSLMHIRPKVMYMTATDRTWLRKTKDDFWQKENELLGEQEVLQMEIYGATGNPDRVFAYAPRHDDYRTQRSLVTGPMREAAYSTWHMARDFQTEPALNDEFIRCEPTKRVLRSTNDPAWYGMIQNRIVARRLVPKYARH